MADNARLPHRRLNLRRFNENKYPSCHRDPTLEPMTSSYSMTSDSCKGEALGLPGAASPLFRLNLQYAEGIKEGTLDGAWCFATE